MLQIVINNLENGKIESEDLEYILQLDDIESITFLKEKSQDTKRKLNENIKKYISLDFFDNIREKVHKNISDIKNRNVEFEDLSALIYLKSKILGIEQYDQYRQVAIDEAQDFGDFSFYALKYLLKNATFSIFGDLAQ